MRVPFPVKEFQKHRELVDIRRAGVDDRSLQGTSCQMRNNYIQFYARHFQRLEEAGA